MRTSARNSADRRHKGRDILKKYAGIFLLTALVVVISLVLVTFGTDSLAKFFPGRKGQQTMSEPAKAPEETAAPPVKQIIDRPLKWTKHRSELAKEYTQIHYGINTDTIVPKAIVVHWTATKDAESVYNFFYPEETSDPEYDGTGKLNVSSQFLVDRDGTIFRLGPETALNRHAIGLNWCSIGIENVGGVNDAQDLTEEQLQSNLFLIRYLKDKYPTISYVLGHYQQDYGKTAGLWIEKLPDYYAGKPDPGPVFMHKLQVNLQDTDIKFFPTE